MSEDQGTLQDPFVMFVIMIFSAEEEGAWCLLWAVVAVSVVFKCNPFETCFFECVCVKGFLGLFLRFILI